MFQQYRRPILRSLTYALAVVLVPFLVGAAGMSVRIIAGMRADTNPPPFGGALPAHDVSKRTAVVIAANSGAEGSDFLGPYEVLDRSGAFNLSAVTREQQRPAIERVHQGGTYAYDVTIGDIARRSGRTIATEVAHQLEYPIGNALAAAPRYRLDLIVRLAILALVGLWLAPLIEKRRAARQQRRQVLRTEQTI